MRIFCALFLLVGGCVSDVNVRSGNVEQQSGVTLDGGDIVNAATDAQPTDPQDAASDTTDGSVSHPPVISNCSASSAGYFVDASAHAGGAGTFQAPFTTLAQAQTKMRGGTLKTTFVRGGTYALTQPITLTTADAGEKWSTCSGDTAAVIDGSGSNAGEAFYFQGADHVTINGLTIRNFSAGGISSYWDGYAGAYNTITNCEVYNIGIGINDSTAHRFENGGIVFGGNSITNTTISNNFVHDTGCMGIRLAPAASMTGSTIANNVLIHTQLSTSDCGAIYLVDPIGASKSVTIANNVIAEWHTLSTSPAGMGIYLDNGTSNVTVTGNTITAPITNAVSVFAIDVHGGGSNILQGNYIDIGSTATNAGILIDQPCHTTTGVTCSSANVDGKLGKNSFSANVVLYNFASITLAGAAICIGDEGTAFTCSRTSDAISGNEFSLFTQNTNNADGADGFSASNQFINPAQQSNLKSAYSRTLSNLGPVQGYTASCPTNVSTQLDLVGFADCSAQN
jgi:hypothetical protein